MPLAKPLRARVPILLLLFVSLIAAACTASTETEPRGDRDPSARNDRAAVPSGAWFDAACELPSKLFTRHQRDYFPDLSPEIVALPAEPNYFGGFVGTSHSGPWDYVQEIPIVFYGPGIIARRGEIDPGRETTLADIAPTMAEMLDMRWPGDRPGRSLSEVLLPEAQREDPALVMVVVWDGGGTNVLEQWPDSWPNLDRFMQGGAYVTATVGSSPSNTPPAHANIGTGAFPDQHGIVDIKVRDGERVVDPWVGKPPRYLKITTIADLYDQEVGNRAEIGLFGFHPWHLGMLGHGSFIEGGDKDHVALVHNSGKRIVGVPDHFNFPAYAANVAGLDEDIRTVDAGDGQVDDRWLGHDALSDPFSLKHSPAYILYQTRILREMIVREGFGTDDIADLFFVNYKPLDPIGHKFNMIEPEVESALRYTDGELAKLEELLDEVAGEGRWVMVVTADHGQTPAALSTGAWPINMDEVRRDLAAEFGVEVADLLDESRVGHFWIAPDALAASDISLQRIANFLTRYELADNLGERDAPEGYEDRLEERLFAAAWPTKHTDAIAGCVKD